MPNIFRDSSLYVRSSDNQAVGELEEADRIEAGLVDGGVELGNILLPHRSAESTAVHPATLANHPPIDGCTDSTDEPHPTRALSQSPGSRRSASMNRRSESHQASNHASVADSTGSQDSGQGQTDNTLNGRMDSLIEYRRRKPSIDSPTGATQLTNLMSRERFSLDDMPLTPRTPGMSASEGFMELPRQDQRNFALLVLLYFVQGVPMGLAMGSIPVLLKAHLSYSQIGTFSLASYPYSLKLLWSPVVDAVWSRSLGRRKSWIVPVQMVSGFGLLYLGANARTMLASAGAVGGAGIVAFTIWWFTLVAMCATQDIAVDGWALTLLSPQNLAYASTAQTVGLTAGQFLSYTVFLALNSADFANRWFRPIESPGTEGLLSLGSYLTMAGWLYIIVTIALAFMKREEKTRENDSLTEVYIIMGRILRLRHIQTFLLVHLFAKIGFQANEAATNLKLLDKGFGQENISLTALIDFPIEIALGYWVGSWSAKKPPMQLWCWSFMARLAAALLAQLVVSLFPSGGVTMWYLCLVIISHVLSTVTGTIMFVAIAAFHAKIADPTVGGTYMTLLAT